MLHGPSEKERVDFVLGQMLGSGTRLIPRHPEDLAIGGIEATSM